MTAQDIKAAIRNLLVQRFPQAAALDPDKLAMDTVADWDSMAQVEVVVGLESLFGIEADANLVEAASLNDLVRAVEAALQGAARPVA